MPGLANATNTRKVIKALQRAGFEPSEGSRHTLLRHPDGRYTTIPRHPKIKVSLLRAIIKQCSLTEQQFLNLYR